MSNKKKATFDGGISRDEWDSLFTFGTSTLARILGCTRRYCSDHARDFGGTYVGRRWVFTKDAVARVLGVDDGGKDAEVA